MPPAGGQWVCRCSGRGVVCVSVTLELQVCAGGRHRWKPDNELGGESFASCRASAATGPDVCVWRATILHHLPDDDVYHTPCCPTSANALRHCVANQYFASLAWQPQLHSIFFLLIHVSFMLTLRASVPCCVCDLSWVKETTAACECVLGMDCHQSPLQSKSAKKTINNYREIRDKDVSLEQSSIYYRRGPVCKVLRHIRLHEHKAHELRGLVCRWNYFVQKPKPAAEGFCSSRGPRQSNNLSSSANDRIYHSFLLWHHFKFSSVFIFIKFLYI